jgi:hypothetical protein
VPHSHHKPCQEVEDLDGSDTVLDLSVGLLLINPVDLTQQVQHINAYPYQQITNCSQHEELLEEEVVEG